MESITDAVHQSTAPAFILAAIGATLNALIARHARVFEAMREISSIEGDPDLLNHAMALMLSRYRLLGNAIRFALGSAASMCALVIATFVDVTLSAPLGGFALLFDQWSADGRHQCRSDGHVVWPVV